MRAIEKDIPCTVQKRGRGRPPLRRATITLALPPSANNNLANVAGKGRVRSPTYNAWCEQAGWEIAAACVAKVPGLFAVHICAGKPDKQCHLDNLTKPLLDALQASGVIQNDRMATRIVCEWSARVPPGRVTMEVRQFSTPETRLRLSVAVQSRRAGALA